MVFSIIDIKTKNNDIVNENVRSLKFLFQQPIPAPFFFSLCSSFSKLFVIKIKIKYVITTHSTKPLIRNKNYNSKLT